MHDPRERWDDEIYDETAGTGLLWQTARNVGILIVVCLLVAGGLTLGKSDTPEPATRGDAAEPAPEPRTYVTRDSAVGEELIIPGGQGGHFLANAEIDGIEMRFMVDTGATQVILTAGDAERLGYRVDLLEFSERFHTANGIVEGAPIVLPEVRIGRLWVEDVDASVIRAPLATSLLGMSFLNRLQSYEVRPEGLVLRW